VKAQSGQALTYVYYEEEPAGFRRRTPRPRRSSAHRGEHREVAGAFTALDSMQNPVAAKYATPTSDQPVRQHHRFVILAARRNSYR